MKYIRVALVSVLSFFIITSCGLEMERAESARIENTNTNTNIVLDNNRGENDLLQDGIYLAEAKGYGGPVAVEMNVKDGYIKKVRINSHNENLGVAGLAIKELPKEIVSKQSVKIDSVSGATTTSEAIKKAAGDCIRQAGGNND